MILFVVLVISSAIMFKIGASLRRKHDEHLPGLIFLSYLGIFFLLGTGSFAIWMFSTPEAASQAEIRGYVAFFIWLPPLYQLSQFVGAWVGAFVTDSLFASSIVSTASRGYGKAQALARNGDIAGAKQAYLSYFKEDPAVPDPLFAAAHMLEMQSRPADAERMYKAILQSFEKNDDVWGRAAWQLSVLYEQQLKSPEQTRELCKKIMHRMPKLEPGKRAIAWLVNEGKAEKENPEDKPDTPRELD
jgi:hypothetical protein